MSSEPNIDELTADITKIKATITGLITELPANALPTVRSQLQDVVELAECLLEDWVDRESRLRGLEVLKRWLSDAISASNLAILLVAHSPSAHAN